MSKLSFEKAKGFSLSKYSIDELQLAIGQDCLIVYFKDEIDCVIVSVDVKNALGYETCIVRTNDQHIKEAFFIHRIKSVPFLDSLRETKLWKLLHE